MYTKKGKPLLVSGDIVHSRSGTLVGRVHADRVYSPQGQYVGTIVGDRLVYRSTDSAGIRGTFVHANRAGIAKADRAGSAIWGDEPDIPD